MANRLKVTANGRSFGVRCGAVLLDSALIQGVELPHDCRAGRCGSCLTRVRRGVTVGGESPQPGMVYACQARVLSDLDIEVESLPDPVRIGAWIGSLTELCSDVVQLEIQTETPPGMLPGQYCRFAFKGFPARSYSPTAALLGPSRPGTFFLHIQRVRDGRVSSQLGHTIQAGHPLTIEGPFGTAFHRPGRSERLVLAASGTGFAPIYAVAEAALREDFNRHIVMVAGARRLQSLYMPAALGWMSTAPNVTVIATADEAQSLSRVVRTGTPADHLPPLSAHDVVYAAGGPRIVKAVSKVAVEAGAQVHFDVFQPAGPEETGGGLGGLVSKMSAWAKKPAMARSEAVPMHRRRMEIWARGA